MVRAVLEGGLTLKGAAAAFNVSPKTVSKWVGRFKQEGSPGLQARTSRPIHQPKRISESLRRMIIKRRCRRWTCQRIASLLGLSKATVSRVLRSVGLQRLSRLDPPDPPNRYQREHPGELLHIDIKKLGRIVRPGKRVTGKQNRSSRGAGWEFLHVCIDDASRIAYAEVLQDERKESACSFLDRAVAYYRSLGITSTGVMTDNGSCYISKAFAKACDTLSLRHLRTRPYTPRTNGKAERFIQSATREWAYGRAFGNSDQRTQALPRWLHSYNWHRPHSSLSDSPPISTLKLERDNLLTLHS